MAVIAFEEAADHASAVETRQGIRYRAPYNVTVDNDRDGANEILNYLSSIDKHLNSTLRYGDMENPGTYCSQIEPTRKQNSRREWLVVLTYEPPQSREEQNRESREGGMSDNPADWRYEIETGTQLVQAPVWKAWNIDPFEAYAGSSGYIRPAGVLGPVVNSAGIVLDPPLMATYAETYYRIRGWHPTFDPLYTDGIINRINGLAVYWHDYFGAYHSMGSPSGGFDRYTLKCTAARARYQRFNEQPWWEYDYEFRYRTRYSDDDPTPWDGWLESVLDRGMTRWAGPGGDDGFGGSYSLTGDDHPDGIADLAGIRGPGGERVGELVLLDGTGQPLTTADAENQTGVYFRWRVNPEHSFINNLPLLLFQV